MNGIQMPSRTVQRLKSSISLRIAVGGLALLVVAAVSDAGLWSGIAGLLGIYFVLLATLFFAVIELLKVSGY